MAVIESINKDPDKYRPLIDSKNTYSIYYTYGQNHPDKYDLEASKAALIEEADKVYNNIAKEEMEKVITDYSLINIPQRYEEQDPVSQAVAVTSRTRVYTEEYTFVHSEIEDD